jgi:hypothetical protein
VNKEPCTHPLGQHKILGMRKTKKNYVKDDVGEKMIMKFV